MPFASARPALSSLPKGVTLGELRGRGDERLSSGSATLDRLLGGGFPRGRLSEVFGGASSGRTSLALRLLAATTVEGEIAALVDCRDRLDPRCARAAGIVLSRVLWVRPSDERDALRCCEILLGTERLGLVVLDLADGVSPIAAARFSSAWPRLAREAAAAHVTLVLLSRERLAGSFAALCVALRAGRALWPRHALRTALFDGIASRAEIVRAREGAMTSRQAVLNP
ncbi:MAG TPA: hypothetical protein VMR29_11980 [Candidatus Binatia bacterium]|nr:hypothetical protein [Candidatus Binatia bacterium]